MAEGCDISEHQGVWSGDQFAAYDFVIIRAYNENGFPDRTFPQNWANASGRTLRGVYGWPVPGGSNLALGAQLVAIAPGAEAGYWADVERSGRGLASAADVRDYLIGIGDHVRGFYSNIPECPRTPFLDGEMWWVADYGPNDGTRHDPDEQAPRPARGYTIHQYTSNPLDLNWSENLDWLGDTDVNEDQNKWLQAIYQRLGGDGQAARGVLDDVIAGKAVQGYISNLNLLDVLNEIKDALGAAGQGGGGGLTEAQVKAIVRAELDKTKLGT